MKFLHPQCISFLLKRDHELVTGGNLLTCYIHAKWMNWLDTESDIESNDYETHSEELHKIELEMLVRSMADFTCLLEEKQSNLRSMVWRWGYSLPRAYFVVEQQQPNSNLILHTGGGTTKLNPDPKILLQSKQSQMPKSHLYNSFLWPYTHLYLHHSQSSIKQEDDSWAFVLNVNRFSLKVQLSWDLRTMCLSSYTTPTSKLRIVHPFIRLSKLNRRWCHKQLHSCPWGHDLLITLTIIISFFTAAQHLQ